MLEARVHPAAEVRNCVDQQRCVRANGATVAHLVLVDGIALPLLIKGLVETLLLHHLSDIDVLEGDGRLLDEELCMGSFARARRASDDDDWGFS